jgi:hypothetical protein
MKDGGLGEVVCLASTLLRDLGRSFGGNADYPKVKIKYKKTVSCNSLSMNKML